MVTRQQVVDAYRYILGREPESEEVINGHLGVDDLAELRGRFVASPEFAMYYGKPAVRTDIEQFLPAMDLPSIRVDASASAAELQLLLNRIKEEWEGFGRDEPHWSVLTHDAYKKKSLEKNRDEFFQSGEYNARIVLAFMARNGLALAPLHTCLELGCGVGRITLQLARVFPAVIGVDISRSHLEVCREALQASKVSNVQLMQLTDVAAIRGLPSFDIFVSFIVLQHNPPPVIKLLLEAVLGRLNRGGVAIFHVPTYRRGYTFNLAKYLRHPGPLRMEMHVLPQSEVFAVIDKAGCQVIEVREDSFASGRSNDAVSNTFFVRKP